MMTKFKKGFSLIEVMLLFTVLAVFMAASLPTITRNSRPIPTKAAHGVYRCINDNGTLREYLFSSSRAIYGNNGRVVQQCTFNVPTAAMYKVDLYSAGAGGTKYAKIYTNQDDNRKANYNLTGMDRTSYEGPSTEVEPLRMPEDEELAIFDDLKVIKTAYTKDGGKGGNASLSYLGGKDSECTAYNTLKEAVKSVYNKYKQKCDDAQTEYNSEQKKYDTADDNIKGWDNYDYWHNKTDYDDQIANGDCGYNCRYYAGKLKEKEDELADQKKICDNEDNKYNDDKVTAACNKVNSTSYHSINWYINDYTTKKNNNCSKNTVQGCINRNISAYSGYSGINRASEVSKRSDAAQAKKDIQTGDYTTYACSKYTGAKSSYGSKYNGGDLTTNAIANNTYGVGSINSIDTYEAAKAVRAWWKAGKLSGKYPAGSMFDPDRTNGNVTGFLDHQFIDYCQAYFPNISPYTYTTKKYTSSASGGNGGKGKYLRVTFPIRYVPSSYNANKRANYLKNIITEGNHEGFYVMTCKQIGENGIADKKDCELGNNVKPGEPGKDKSVDYQTQRSELSLTGAFGPAFSACVKGQVICDQQCTSDVSQCTKDADARRSIRQFLKVQDPELFFADEAYNTLFDFNSAVSDIDLNALDSYNTDLLNRKVETDNLLASITNTGVVIDKDCTAAKPHRCVQTGECISCPDNKFFNQEDCSCQCLPYKIGISLEQKYIDLYKHTMYVADSENCIYACLSDYIPNTGSNKDLIPCLCPNGSEPTQYGICSSDYECQGNDVSRCGDGDDNCWDCVNHKCTVNPLPGYSYSTTSNKCVYTGAVSQCTSDDDCKAEHGDLCEKCVKGKCTFDSNNASGFVGVWNYDGKKWCHYGQCTDDNQCKDKNGTLCRFCFIHKQTCNNDKDSSYIYEDSLNLCKPKNQGCRAGHDEDCGDPHCWNCDDFDASGTIHTGNYTCKIQPDNFYTLNEGSGVCEYNGCEDAKNLTYDNYHRCVCKPEYKHFCSNELGCIKECVGGKEFIQSKCDCICPSNKPVESEGHCCPSDRPYYYDNECHKCPKGKYECGEECKDVPCDDGCKSNADCISPCQICNNKKCETTNADKNGFEWELNEDKKCVCKNKDMILDEKQGKCVCKDPNKIIKDGECTCKDEFDYEDENGCQKKPHECSSKNDCDDPLCMDCDLDGIAPTFTCYHSDKKYRLVDGENGKKKCVQCIKKNGEDGCDYDCQICTPDFLCAISDDTKWEIKTVNGLTDCFCKDPLRVKIDGDCICNPDKYKEVNGKCVEPGPDPTECKPPLVKNAAGDCVCPSSCPDKNMTQDPKTCECTCNTPFVKSADGKACICKLEEECKTGWIDSDTCTCNPCTDPQIPGKGRCVCKGTGFKEVNLEPNCECIDPNSFRDQDFLTCTPCSGDAKAVHLGNDNEDHSKDHDRTGCSCKHIDGSQYVHGTGCVCPPNHAKVNNKCVCSGAVCGREPIVFATNGQDVTEYVAFHIPDLMHTDKVQPQESKEKIMTTILKDQLATGGGYAKIVISLGYGSYIDSDGKMISPLPYENHKTNIAAADYAHHETAVQGENGKDTKFSGPKTIQGVYDNSATLDAVDNPEVRDQEPRMKLETKLWTKYFDLGQGGEPGDHKHFVTTNLGQTCNFTVPRGGAVLNLLNNGERPDIEAWEANLAVFMTCTNREGELVFNQKIDGGKYNLEYFQTPKYWWSKEKENRGSFTYLPTNPSEKVLTPRWMPTSLFARAYQLFMGGRANYDLNRFRISYAGEGTTLVDHCVQPRGTFRRYMVYVQDGVEKIISGRDTGNVNEAKGFFNGVQCYPAAHEGASSEQLVGVQRELYDNDPLVQAGAYEVRAGSGGGGAVVITW